MNDNTELRNHVRALEEKLEDLGALRFHWGCYWRERKDGSYDGPYSQQTWDVSRKLVRMYSRGRTAETPVRFIFRDHETKLDVYVPETFLTEHRASILTELKRD